MTLMHTIRTIEEHRASPQHIAHARNVMRLGRHVHHDARSRHYALEDRNVAIASRVWVRRTGPFDQGNLGSCGGNAGGGLVMTDPLWKPPRAWTETEAVGLYSDATRLDVIPGTYPPDDTGTTGLAVAKVLRARGLVSRYEHAFTLGALLEALSTQGPLLFGCNWYEGFDAPVPDQAAGALCVLSGNVRGGHEIELVGVDVKAQRVTFWNSWGASWGNGGEAAFDFETVERLLAEQGDAILCRPGTSNAW